jgi:signal transduction histidine kinase
LADIYGMETKPGPTIFSGFRLRHAVALLVCLALILILAGYFSVSAGQRASLEALKSQGRALTETLISSAQMVIQSDDAITRLAIDKLIDIEDGFNIPAGFKNDSTLENWARALDADKVSLVVDRKVKSSSVTRVNYLDNDAIEVWLDSLEINPDDEVIYDFRTLGSDRYMWGYFPVDDTIGLFAAVNWKYGQYGNQNLSLANLLNQVGQESGIEYIMLQNQDGIVFASKKVASMPRLADDPFLVASMQSDSTRSRMIMFQDRQVLETVRTFKSGDFQGLFRVGLSLYGYRQIAHGVRRQVWLAVLALIIIGMLAFGIITGFQNVEFLKSGLEKARVVSQSLLDSIPSPVIAVDSHLNISDINIMAKSRLGLSPSVTTGADYLKFFSDDPFQFQQVMKTRRSVNFERSIGEEHRQYYITTTPLVGSDAASIGAIAIAQDITESRRLEATAESRRRLSELGALAASMAHEIRNPLNAIGLTIQRMKNEIKPAGSESEYQKFIDGLRSEIRRLNDIIEKFLAVARSVRPEIAVINVRDLVQNVAELFQSQALAQKIKLSYDAPTDLAVEGDKAGLTQALVNVVKNSFEAVGEGGEITITAAELNGKIHVAVKDNGPGMPDASLAQKPFYTTKKDGTGLGLATTSKIMADHGGELIINSSPGQGCQVDLVLPKRKT